MTFSHALSTNRYGEGDLIVSTSAANGTHVTLASAMAAAVSGQTIFLRDSVTENVTITPGVNIAAWQGASLNTPTIIGTVTMTAAGTSTISGVRLQTNGAALVAVTGSAASILKLNNCYINCTNNTGITHSSSNAGSIIVLTDCTGDIGTTGISLFTSTSAGIISIYKTIIGNSGNATTASSVSTGAVLISYSNLFFPLVTSSVGFFSITNSSVDNTASNTASLTTAGTGTSLSSYTSYASGTASAISIGAGTTVNITFGSISSSNTNAITGAGSIIYSGLIFTGSSFLINTTTQTGGLLKGGQFQAPSAGFIGETITATASAVATTSATPKTITSITLTPGNWVISGIWSATATGGTVLMQTQSGSISLVDNTAGVLGAGIDRILLANGVSTVVTMSGSVPQYPVSITTTTTYYLVVNNIYSSTTCPTNARITATRVG